MMQSIRKWWAKALLLTICLAIMLESLLFVFISVLPATEETSWLDTLCFGSMIWIFILSTSVSIIAFMGFVARLPKPEFNNLGKFTAWGLVGGIAALCLPLTEYLFSCCYQGDMYFLVCFGPLLFLMGFGISSRMQKGTLPLIAIFLTPVIGAYLEPALGLFPSLIVNLSIIVGAVGLIIYWRLKA
jgi:hypothetical protein